MADTHADAPPVDLAGAVRDIEARDRREKAAGAAVILAVWHADPDTLPPAVRAARAKLGEAMRELVKA